jgi:pimeloyl-ACP methyl ester carboxylesterase
MSALTGGGVHDAELETRLAEVPCATLAVFGQNDMMVAAEAPRIYREKIPNCNISFVYDAGHAILVDRPEALISAVSDFIERRETFIVGRDSGLINP